ncbi:hypothetical protein LWI29_038010 [Acer saccharum]|uniref:F-box domain-containing protein n=1 Tax=Acer saccharum TaxID=4024 RepID=A0AA39SLP8_ACESA|nr:hypothetical protein LWI29_038010 [Acer saccharum]
MEDLGLSRKQVKINRDRLSNLPDSIVHHILSLMDAKYAVQTCILSKKWKFHWAHVPCYTFDRSTSSTDIQFQDFVANVLNNRQSFNLSRPRFRVSGITLSCLVKMFYQYILSCRFEELDIRKKVQIIDQMVVDQLSSLPEHIIYQILSLMDTKYAVQTCVLSKKWRNHWTNVHSLNFVHSSFSTWVGFKEFVLDVFWRWGLKSLTLRKLKFICGRTTASKNFVMTVFDYATALPHRLEEVETDVIGDFPQSLVDFKEGLYKCNTLKTLKVYHRLEKFLGCESLTTLQISALLPRDFIPYWFDEGLYLKNLLFVNCVSGEIFSLFLDTLRLDTLTISNLRFCEKINIYASALGIFNWKGESPCLLSFESFNRSFIPKEVNIHISPPVDCPTKKWFTAMRDMVKGCRDVKSITVLLNISKGTFILSYRYADAETKVMELKKETGDERVLFVYHMVNGFDFNQFATILEELFGEKEAHISNQMEIDRLSNLPDHIIYDILSFLDTKYAVQTCVLSKKWRYHWTHIHNLNLECRSNTITNFKKFVLHVLRHRKPLNLNRLRFHFNGRKSQSLVESISNYALSKSVEELDTNVTFQENLYGFQTNIYECQTLRTLKLGPYSSDLPDLSSLTLLTTLELIDVWLPDCDFSECLVLENLTIIECEVRTTLKISAPRLVELFISNFRSSKRNKNGKVVLAEPNEGMILITTPRLKFFNLKDVDPLVLSMDDCPTLEKVDILMSKPFCDFFQKIGDKKQTFILDMFHMIEGLIHAKSLRISLNFTKEKFVLRHNNEKTKIAMLNKTTAHLELRLASRKRIIK